MINIKYVGKKDSRADTVANTGLVWTKGQVHPVSDSKAALLLVHPDIWAIASGKDRVATKVVLLGSTWQPEVVEYGNGMTITTAALVEDAFLGAGLSVDEWNAQSEDVLKALLAEHLKKIEAEKPLDEEDETGFQKINVETMSKNELQAFALSQSNTKLNPRDSIDAMRKSVSEIMAGRPVNS